MKFTTDRTKIERCEKLAEMRDPNYRYSVIRLSDAAQRFQAFRPRCNRVDYVAWDNFKAEEVA